MEKWKLEPAVSIGNIKFGMDRAAVRQLYPEGFTEFKKTKFSKNTTDDFGRFHVYYTTDNKVDAVEVFDSIEVELNGVKIFPVPVDIAEKILGSLEKDEDCYIQADLSIGIYAPEKKAESILAGSKGYY